jgi:cytochrome c oxidase subunit II
MWEEFALIPERASTTAESIDGLFLTISAITIFFSALIGSAVIGLAVLYRRRPNVPSRKFADVTWLEVTWTAIPLAISLVLFAWGLQLFVHTRTPPPGSLEIYVTGKQWMWKFQHPQGPREINMLHVPLGRPVRLTMSSEDVIHSLYVPAFRVKMDVLPGMYSVMWFEATKLGRHHLFCAEYCGTKHSEMVGWVEVLTPQEYQRWLSGTPAGETTAERGEQLFTDLGCVSCHKEGPTARGPALAELYGRKVQLEGGATAIADESYLRESIIEPNAKIVRGYKPIMPTFTNQITEEQVLQIVAYVRTLTKTSTGGSQ